MFNISIEMPSGARSIGYDREVEDKALATFERVVGQLKSWRGFAADVVLFGDRSEIQREHINGAA